MISLCLDAALWSVLFGNEMFGIAVKQIISAVVIHFEPVYITRLSFFHHSFRFQVSPLSFFVTLPVFLALSESLIDC